MVKLFNIFKNQLKKNFLLRLVIGVIFVIVVFAISCVWVGLHSDQNGGNILQIAFKPKTTNIQEAIEIEVNNIKSLEITANSTFSTDSKIPNFVFLNNSKLIIAPKNGDVGNYSFKIVYQEKEENYIKTFDVKIIEKLIDFNKLKKEIVHILGEQKNNYAVVVWDLKRQKGFDINGDVIKPPASISKIPYAILTLRDIDKGKNTLDEVYKIRGDDKAYDTDILYSYENGADVTLDQYIKFLIQQSDNTAMMHLEDFLGGNQIYNQRVRDELGLTNLFRDPHTTSANQVSILLQNIYSQKYLSKKLNDYLIDTMINVDATFQDRIKEGVPENVPVAHKIGNLEGIYQDAGIVYGQKTDFVIVVLNENTSIDSAKETIREITRKVYNELE
jgi:beta-lactamase class A